MSGNALISASPTRFLPVIFYFDKMIWSKILKMEKQQQELLKSSIESLFEKGDLLVVFSPINLIELVDGIDKQNYELCKEELRLIGEITQFHLLEDPWEHVKRVTGNRFGLELDSPRSDYLAVSARISRAEFYESLENIIESIKKKVREFEDSWVTFTKETKEFALKLSKEKLGQLRTPAVGIERQRELWKGFCRHYPVASETYQLTLDQALGCFPIFRAWVDIQMVYHNQMIFGNRNPEPQDYLDIEQTVYVNVFDYFVTEEKRIHRMVEQTQNIELQGRFIRFDNFLFYLEHGLPAKRAPEPINKVWVDAR
jgi:hypothetical protein